MNKLMERTFHSIEDENYKQGMWGEELARKFFERAGFQVIKSNDRYSYYDFEVIDFFGEIKKVQVKTMTRLQWKNYFSIKDGVREETINNALKCDLLIIVSRDPHPSKAPIDALWGGMILVVMNHRSYETVNGEYIIPALEENLRPVYRLTDEERAQVNSFQTQRP